MEDILFMMKVFIRYNITFWTVSKMSVNKYTLLDKLFLYFGNVMVNK